MNASVSRGAALALVTALGCASRTETHAPPYGIGSTAPAAAIAPLDIDVAIDGAGLPSGRGTAQDGAPIYAASCRSCHGVRIAIRRWRYPTALFDYIRRAMPPQRRRRLSPSDLFAVTAYLLYADGRIGAHDIVDRDTLIRPSSK